MDQNIAGNPVKWRRSPSWWDSFAVEEETRRAHPDANLFTWLETVAPEPMEHDFILYTDGSGCTKGWGAAASVVQQVVYDEEIGGRRPLYTELKVSGNYGQTVQRNELSALLEGVWTALGMKLNDLRLDPMIESAEKSIQALSGDQRITILWYTDRMNLAKSLLYDEDGNYLNSRSTDSDLWLRWSAFARRVCVTPMCVPRNVVRNQAMCDALCTAAREAMMERSGAFEEITKEIYNTEKWTLKKPQGALF